MFSGGRWALNDSDRVTRPGVGHAAAQVGRQLLRRRGRRAFLSFPVRPVAGLFHRTPHTHATQLSYPEGAAAE